MRHDDVKDDDVGNSSFDQIENFRAVIGHADEIEIGLSFHIRA